MHQVAVRVDREEQRDVERDRDREHAIGDADMSRSSARVAGGVHRESEGTGQDSGQVVPAVGHEDAKQLRLAPRMCRVELEIEAVVDESTGYAEQHNEQTGHEQIPLRGRAAPGPARRQS